MNNKAVAIIDYDAGNIKSVQKAVELYNIHDRKDYTILNII